MWYDARPVAVEAGIGLLSSAERHFGDSGRKPAQASREGNAQGKRQNSEKDIAHRRAVRPREPRRLRHLAQKADD